jgi:tetratricopeptide (TPR) repeat protein
LVVLTGPGGVGKTALAVQWGHSVRDRFPDGQLYVDLGGFSGGEPVDPREALSRFLRAFGVPAPHIPLALAEQAALFRSVTAGRSMLMVLDNAFSAAQVRSLLPAPGSGVVVVTSRNRLVGLVPDGARLLDLAPLGVDDSVSLLARAVGGNRIDKEWKPAEQLAVVCGGLPIALCVAAARLAGRPRLSVGQVVSELADEAGRLGGLSAIEGTSVQATFDLSYRSLNSHTAKLYRRLALHPGPEFGYGPVGALMPTLGVGTSAGASVNAVGGLLDASLLQEADEDRFRFHDLLLLHARRQADVDDTEHDRAIAVVAMLEWYLMAAARADVVITPYRRRLPYRPATAPADLPVLSDRDEALDWLELERVNLVDASRVALEYGQPSLAWQLCDVMWPLFLYRKHYRDRMEVDARGVEAAGRWGNGWAEADMLKRLGRVCTVAGDFDSAERHMRAAAAGYRAAGDVHGSVDAEEGLASLYRDRGADETAAAMFTRVLAANRELGDDRRVGLTLINLGMLLPKLGRSAEAIELLGEAQELFARLADVDPYNAVRVMIAMAAAYLGLGELEAAERAAGEAADRMQDLGSEHEYAEAQNLLGEVAERRGDSETARHHYRRASAIFNALGSSRARAVDDRLAGLSDTTR